MTAKKEFLDFLTASAFLKDADGRTVFYPWGMFGRGVIIPNDETRLKFSRLLKFNFLGALVLVLCMNVVAMKYVFAALFIQQIAYFVIAHRMVKGLERSEERLTMARSMTAFAVKARMPMLVFFVFLSLVFVATGVMLVAIGDTTLGLAAVGIFGLMALMYLYAIYLKRTASEQHAA